MENDTINTSKVTARIKLLAQSAKLKILLVDDDELERELLADRLASCGFEVTAAASGQQALAILEHTWFPLILTDWQMPEMDGIELTEQLRSRGVNDTYIIMLTVRDAELDYEHGYFAGVDDYLSKRLPTTDLLARVHAAFSTIRLRQALQAARAALAAANIPDPTLEYVGKHMEMKLENLQGKRG